MGKKYMGRRRREEGRVQRPDASIWRQLNRPFKFSFFILFFFSSFVYKFLLFCLFVMFSRIFNVLVCFNDALFWIWKCLAIGKGTMPVVSVQASLHQIVPLTFRSSFYFSYLVLCISFYYFFSICYIFTVL